MKMKQKNLFLNPAEWQVLIADGEMTLPQRHQSHIQGALRNKAFAFEALNGLGGIAKVQLEDKNRLRLLSAGFIEQSSRFILYSGKIKKKGAELIVQKCTEIGVQRICFFQSDFSQHLDMSTQRVQAIAESACEQSGNPYCPQIEFSGSSLFELNIVEDHVYFGLPGAQAYSESHLDGSRAFINGPEGGWSAEELSYLKNHFRAVSLSSNVLRSETAAILATGTFQ